MRNEEVFESCLQAYKRYLASYANVLSVHFGLDGNRCRPREVDYIADFALVGRAALFGAWLKEDRTKRLKGPARLFSHYYVKRAGEKYDEARAGLKISPQMFEEWDGQVRRIVGGAFRRDGLWPLKHYFRRPTGWKE